MKVKTFLTGTLSAVSFGSAKYFFDILVAGKFTVELKLLMVFFATSSLASFVILLAVVFLMKDDD